MPTKGPRGNATINFRAFERPASFSLDGIIAAIEAAHRKFRFGGLSGRERWLRLFDPSLTDLSTLPIGVFDIKALILPRCHVPQNKAALGRFCRRLIDAGKDAHLIELMTSGRIWSVSLDQHVDDLWKLKDIDERLHEDIVRGRMGRALNRLDKLHSINAVTRKAVKSTIARQLLLWCAMDVQMVACRARLSLVRPVGAFLSGTMTVFKPATLLRLMRALHPVMVKALSSFRPGPVIKRKTPITGVLSRAIGAIHSPGITEPAALVKLQGDLSDVVPILNRLAGAACAHTSLLSAFRSDGIGGGAPAKGLIGGTPLKNFHPVWFSGLTPVEGVSVALVRYVLAERHLETIICGAANEIRRTGRVPKRVAPLPDLPKSRTELVGIIERVLHLVDASRRVHLRDPDWRSRTIPDRENLNAHLLAHPHAIQYEPLDRAGWTFVRRAFDFLSAMGPRRWDAWDANAHADPRHLTFWHMDVVPDLRLAR